MCNYFSFFPDAAAPAAPPAPAASPASGVLADPESDPWSPNNAAPAASGKA